jgi:hypothetical protein
LPVLLRSTGACSALADDVRAEDFISFVVGTVFVVGLDLFVLVQPVDRGEDGFMVWLFVPEGQKVASETVPIADDPKFPAGLFLALGHSGTLP